MHVTDARIKITLTNYEEDVSKVLDDLCYQADTIHMKGDLRKGGKYGEHDRYFATFELRARSMFDIGEELTNICDELFQIEDRLKRICANGSIWITTIQYPPDFLPTNLEPCLLEKLARLDIGLSLESWDKQ